MDDAPARAVLADSAITLMSKVLGSLANLLTALPIGESRPGKNAGLACTLPRSTHALPQRGPAWTILGERAAQIAAACGAGPSYAVLDAVGEDVRRVAERLRAVRDASARAHTSS